jgi:hypothetical protein
VPLLLLLLLHDWLWLWHAQALRSMHATHTRVFASHIQQEPKLPTDFDNQICFTVWWCCWEQQDTLTVIEDMRVGQLCVRGTEEGCQGKH